MKINTLISIVLGGILIVIVGYYAWTSSAGPGLAGQKYTHVVLRDTECDFNEFPSRKILLKEGTKIRAVGYGFPLLSIKQGDKFCSVRVIDIRPLPGSGYNP